MRVHFAAVHTIVEASRDPALKAALSDAELVAADGMPLVWLGRIKGKIVERVCGPDMMPHLLDRSREHGLRHFFYGGSSDLLTALITKVERHFPGIEVAGSLSPPFRALTEAEIRETAALINAAKPDYVWVGLGSPRQDLWLQTFRPLLDASVLLGVGAAFSIQAGRAKRAPAWAQHRGLEWLFRLAAEPRRLGWRYTAMSLRFLWLAAADLFSQPRQDVTQKAFETRLVPEPLPPQPD
jgi:N-acetylglucosaminyldiphosphoundecaprenol N-acetyl-beta-D-mannosaminyltransferase